MVYKLKQSCQTLLNNFVIRIQTFQTFILLYLAPLVNLRLWFWIGRPKPRREVAGSLSNSERQKLKKLYTQGGAAYGSVRNLVKASNLSVSNVRQILHSKPYYTKFSLPHVTSREWRHLLESKMEFKLETWHTLISYLKAKTL